MQLKITRSKRDAGMFTKSVVFCLTARVEFTPEEKRDVLRYKLQKEVIYNSEASRRYQDKSNAQREGSAAGEFKSIASLALARLSLKISIDDLERGQYIECKSLGELLDAENAIMAACSTLRAYLATAATFDGKEVLIDFSGDEPEVIAIGPAPEAELLASYEHAQIRPYDNGAPPHYDYVDNPPDPDRELSFWDALPFDVPADRDTRRLLTLAVALALVLLLAFVWQHFH